MALLMGIKARLDNSSAVGTIALYPRSEAAAR
jgi:hypothetical protein